MDLRELQALHARYSDSPMVIDLPGQMARIPALPLPTAEGTPTIDRHLSHDAQHILATAGKILLALVAAGVVAAAGMQGATIWHKLHRASGPSSPTALAITTAPTQTRAAAVPTVAHAVPLASAIPNSDANTPALTAQDFATPSGLGGKANGLSRLSLADLSRQPVAIPANKTASATDDQQAMAAPIRAHRAQPDASITVDTAPALQRVQSSQAVKTVQAVQTPPEATLAPAMKATPTASDEPDTKPAAPHHREHKHTKAATDTAATDTDKPAPAASRAGADVPLF